MKKLLACIPFVLLIACNVQDPMPVANATSAVESAPLPEDEFPVDGIVVYGVDDNGNPILTPPAGSIDEMIEAENSDSDDLVMRCYVRAPNYACGTTIDGHLLICRGQCICYLICWGNRFDQCDPPVCESGGGT